MNIESMHVGMEVSHPEYGQGRVRALSQNGAEIVFNTGVKTLDPSLSELSPAEPQAEITGLSRPLSVLLRESAEALVAAMGVEQPDSVVDELSARWQNGRMVIHPANAELQSKEVPLEVFFHKIVMMRNNLRVLEQKVNASKQLTEAEKFDMHQYITRCYGSMTTFNVLFKHKEDQFSTK